MKRRSVWPGGATWVLAADIVNDGSNSGDHAYAISPGAGAEVYILDGFIINEDAAGRNVTVRVTDGTNIVGGSIPEAQSLGAGTRMPIYPNISSLSVGGHGQMHLSGVMVCEVRIASIAVSQDTTVGLVCKIRGREPTLSLASPTDATETISTAGVL